mgnify:CR=1 FL=1
MQLYKEQGPHIHSVNSASATLFDVILALLAPVCMAVFYYGFRAFFLVLTSCVVCLLADYLGMFLRTRTIDFSDRSAAITGLILALMLPASVPYWMVVIGGLFAILVVKQPFGGFGKNIFNPAAAAFAFLAICWTPRVFTFPLPLADLPVFGEATVRLTPGMLLSLQNGAMPSNSWFDVLLGNYPGPMGGTSVLVLASCLIFLLFRRSIRFQATVGYLLSVAGVAFLVPRVLEHQGASVFYEVFSGYTLFIAIFVITDMITAPKRRGALWLYALIAGMLTMAFRMVGSLPDASLFAILFANAISGALDTWLYDDRFVSKWLMKGGRRREKAA